MRLCALAFLVLASCGRIAFDERADGGGDGIAGDGAVALPHIALGANHTCVIRPGGGVRCWGLASTGQLGTGNTANIGDDELPRTLADLPLGTPALQVTAGADFTCALLMGGRVRCWGNGFAGRLGNVSVALIGDDESIAGLSDIDLGGTAVEIAAGYYHVCARLASGAVRCWGENTEGQLGYGNVANIGDDETPAAAGDTPIGLVAADLAMGEDHTCARSAGGAVRCWGYGFWGQLGRANTQNIGDNELPSSLGDLPCGVTATQLGSGGSHVCAVHDGGLVRCWGGNGYGQLGDGNVTTIGDDELASAAPDLALTGAIQVRGGFQHTCALLTGGRVRCWGNGAAGQLGNVSTQTIGDNETLGALADIDLGGTAVELAVGGSHSCVVLDTGAIRCWGDNTYGQLGYGNVSAIGDDETPASAGDVPYE